MKLVNPVGRMVTSGVEAHYDVTPYACMCGTSTMFTGARGYKDNCIHCGCDCTSSNYGSGNKRNAATTIHTS